jgi:hypothetical protein
MQCGELALQAHLVVAGVAVFRQRMGDKVRPVRQATEHRRRREGGVDGQQGAVGVGDLRQCSDVGHLGGGESDQSSPEGSSGNW